VKSKTLIIENHLFPIRKLLLLSGIVCFILGVLTVSIEWRNTGSLIVITAFLIFFNLYWSNEKYKEYNKLYQEYRPNESVFKMLNYGTFGFTEKYLIYKSKNSTTRISWNDFSSFKIIESKHIVIKGKEPESNLIISEIDKSDFEEVIELIKNYLEQRV